jgi:hypothetical protein
MRAHPLGPWVKRTTGVGEKTGARLLAAIGDPAALPSVKKALLNYDEPDEVREALQRAEKKLEAVVAAQPTPEPTAVPKKKKAPKPKKAADVLAPVTGPKVSEKK